MKASKLNEKISSVATLAGISNRIGSHIGETTACVIGGYLFKQSEVEDCDWNYYSKAWHRAHGPKKTITDRKVTIYSYNSRRKNPLQVAAVVEFDAWRGNILLAAIKQSGLFQDAATKTPINIRLDRHYDASVIRSIGNVKVWERTLLESHVDYCAVMNGVTFHASTVKAAVKGLHNKIKAATKKRNEPISYRLCKELGFCEEGIKAFCAAFGLDVKATYAPAQIEEIVKTDLSKAAPFESELRVMAKTLNYQASI